MDPSALGFLSFVFLLSGFIATIVYGTTSAKTRGSGAVFVEIVTGFSAVCLLGIGSLFAFVYSGIYV